MSYIQHFFKYLLILLMFSSFCLFWTRMFRLVNVKMTFSLMCCTIIKILIAPFYRSTFCFSLCICLESQIVPNMYSFFQSWQMWLETIFLIYGHIILKSKIELLDCWICKLCITYCSSLISRVKSVIGRIT